MTKISRSDILKKEFLDECFVADFETGTLVWKVRPPHHFPNIKSWKIWNTSYSGRIAGATSWRTKTYLFKRVTICKNYFPIHHVLWIMYYGSMFDSKKFVVDHLDRNPLNNSINNLRLVSQQKNTWNASGCKRSTSLSEFKGVCYDKQRSKWMLQIRCGGGKVSGRFDCELSAAYIYRVISEQVHGEFSPNFLKDVEFPKNFDWKAITPKVKSALMECNETVKLNHHELFSELCIQ